MTVLISASSRLWFKQRRTVRRQTTSASRLYPGTPMRDAASAPWTVTRAPLPPICRSCRSWAGHGDGARTFIFERDRPDGCERRRRDGGARRCGSRRRAVQASATATAGHRRRPSSALIRCVRRRLFRHTAGGGVLAAASRSSRIAARKTRANRAAMPSRIGPSTRRSAMQPKGSCNRNSRIRACHGQPPNAELWRPSSRPLFGPKQMGQAPSRHRKHQVHNRTVQRIRGVPTGLHLPQP